MKKTMNKPEWLNVLTDEKLPVEPFTQTREEVKGEVTKQPVIWHFAETRNWKDDNKPELSAPFQFRMRKELEEKLKAHTIGSKNQVINDILAIGLEELEKRFKDMGR